MPSSSSNGEWTTVSKPTRRTKQNKAEEGETAGATTSALALSRPDLPSTPEKIARATDALKSALGVGRAKAQHPPQQQRQEEEADAARVATPPASEADNGASKKKNKSKDKSTIDAASSETPAAGKSDGGASPSPSAATASPPARESVPSKPHRPRSNLSVAQVAVDAAELDSFLAAAAAAPGGEDTRVRLARAADWLGDAFSSAAHREPAALAASVASPSTAALGLAKAVDTPAADVNAAVLRTVASLAGKAGPAATAELACDAVDALERALVSSTDASPSAADADLEPPSAAGAAAFVAAAMRGCPSAAGEVAERLLSRGWGSSQRRSRLLLWALSQAAAPSVSPASSSGADGGRAASEVLSAWAGVVLPAVVGGGASKGDGRKAPASSFGAAAALDAVAFAEDLLGSRSFESTEAGPSSSSSAPSSSGGKRKKSRGGRGGKVDVECDGSSSAAAAASVPASTSPPSPVEPSALAVLLAGALPLSGPAAAAAAAAAAEGPSTSGKGGAAPPLSGAAPRVVRPKLLTLLPRLSSVASEADGFDVRSAVAGVVAVFAASALSSPPSEAAASAVSGALSPLFAADAEAATVGWRAAVAALVTCNRSRKAAAAGAFAPSLSSSASAALLLAEVAAAVASPGASPELEGELRAFASSAAAALASDGASSDPSAPSSSDQKPLSKRAAAFAERQRRRRRADLASRALATLSLALVAALAAAFVSRVGGVAEASRVATVVAEAVASFLVDRALALGRAAFKGTLSALEVAGWAARESYEAFSSVFNRGRPLGGEARQRPYASYLEL